MNTPDSQMQEFIQIMHQKFGERIKDFLFPPPVFTAMQGQLLEIDLENCTLTTKFPILESHLNPYGTMQGGMIAAAVDNTLGPLSVAIAPPNVTRTLEMKYSQPVTPKMQYIIVHAKLLQREDPILTFEAKVTSPDGRKLATSKATHWIIEQK